MKINKLRDALAEAIFGMKRSDALKGSICLVCKRKIDLATLKPIDKAGYEITPICPACFEKITG